MKYRTLLLTLSVGLLAGGTALAGNRYDDGYPRQGYDYVPAPYVGLSFGALRYDEDGLDTITPSTALLRFGAPLNRNLAIEGRAGGGLDGASSGGYRVSVDSIYAAYLKGSVPLAHGFSLYGVGGVAGVSLRRNFGQGPTRDSGFSYGVGADIYLGNGAGLNIEWTRLPSGNNAGYDYTNAMATVGLTWRL